MCPYDFCIRERLPQVAYETQMGRRLENPSGILFVLLDVEVPPPLVRQELQDLLVVPVHGSHVPFKNGVGDPHQWVEGRGYHGQVHAHGQDALFRLLGSYLVNIVNMRNNRTKRVYLGVHCSCTYGSVSFIVIRINKSRVEEFVSEGGAGGRVKREEPVEEGRARAGEPEHKHRRLHGTGKALGSLIDLAKDSVPGQEAVTQAIRREMPAQRGQALPV
mmetsp:Transcript_57152/g.129484  ORF Transcript_57152/g.129484 Transcript_57152/m.129484 type:complete len:218 (-) Transcript_57152:255-908(-)